MGGVTLPGGPFGCILADPPWRFVTYDRKSAVPSRVADPYATMSRDDLRALGVAASAARDCALFMWVSDPLLDQGIDLGRAWGFQFKTKVLTWRKTTADGSKARMGMGYWSRKQTEICLLFTRGKPRRLSRGVPEIIDAPRREHSRKPDEQYARIEALVGGPYLEMFARQTWPGWTAWGNETARFAPVEVAA